MLVALSNLWTSPELGLVPVLLAQAAEAEGGMNPVQILVFLATYAFCAYACQMIFEKCGVEFPWFAWIPVLGTYAGLQAGDEEQPLLWTVLSIIPCVGIISLIKIIPAWIKICNKIGKSPWILLAILVPLLGPFITFGYLAFA